MIIAHQNLVRTLTLLLLAAIFLIGGCEWFSATRKPIEYSSVMTVAGVGDIGEPFGIAINDGVVYFSDGENGTIRKIDSSGSVEVFASGLNTPSAIAFLPGGELVIADTGSHTIKTVSKDGTVSLLAGVAGTTGSSDGPIAAATFNAPIGLAVADDGSIYVADTYNDRIRLIREGVVTTIAGERRGYADGVGKAASFDTPLGLAIYSDKLLVADSGNARVRVIDNNGIVSTLAGGDDRDLRDGSLASARFVNPTAIAVDELGSIFIADGNAMRAIGRRVLPVVETLAGDQRGFQDGDARRARFNRPSGLAVGADRKLYVADSDNRAVRVISDDVHKEGGAAPELIEDQLPLATRWPFDPPTTPREIAGTLGEIRGDLKPDGKPVWFHNGLDIAGAYGETTKFIRDETVLDPHSSENFGTSRELLRLPLIGYIHLRLGRDKDDRAFGDQRFQFESDATGKLVGLRVPRGARFAAGDPIGTLNAMNHVHLIAGRSGREINALSALDLPGAADSIPPVIEDLLLYDNFWIRDASLGDLPGKIRIVVRAYDRMDGNSERRRLGVYKVGYQLLSNGTPLGDIEWRIRFERSPSNESVRLAYANGSRSGYTPDTVFNYIATNRVDGENAQEDFLDSTSLAPGRYTLRVFAADYFGNVTSRDVEVVK